MLTIYILRRTYACSMLMVSVGEHEMKSASVGLPCCSKFASTSFLSKGIVIVIGRRLQVIAD